MQPQRRLRRRRIRTPRWKRVLRYVKALFRIPIRELLIALFIAVPATALLVVLLLFVLQGGSHGSLPFD